jgi:selenocysteine-specific elongation factor
VPLAELRTRLGRLLRRLATVDSRAGSEIVDGLVAALVARGAIRRERDQVLEPGRSGGPTPATLAAMDRLERALAVAGPPALADALRASGCPPDGVRALETAGRIVRLDDGLAYAAATYRELTETALRLASSGALSPAAFRDATGTSRKYVMAVLEDLDRRGILRRTPDGHVPGPRAGLAAEIGRTVA